MLFTQTEPEIAAEWQGKWKFSTKINLKILDEWMLLLGQMDLTAATLGKNSRIFDEIIIYQSNNKHSKAPALQWQKWIIRMCLCCSCFAIFIAEQPRVYCPSQWLCAWQVCSNEFYFDVLPHIKILTNTYKL